MASHASSLALALSGFSVEAESNGSEALPPGGAAGRAAPAAADKPRAVAAGAAALVQHASTIAARVLQSWQGPGYDPSQDAEQLASLCFALQSAVGCGGRLGAADERCLFELAAALWDASLQALPAAGGSGSSSLTDALECMGSELYGLVEGDSDSTHECSRYVAAFCRLAGAWQAAGQRQRAQWCQDRAMRYSQQVWQGSPCGSGWHRQAGGMPCRPAPTSPGGT